MPARLIALLLGLAAAVPLAIWGYRAMQPEVRAIGFLEVDDDLLEKVTEETSSRRGEKDFRVPLDEETVRKVMPLKGPRVYDPHCYFYYKPGLSAYREWDEHPGGGFTRATNDLGLCMNDEVSTDPLDLRVLVAGDSHMAGVCNNGENFPAQLELRLRDAHPDRSVQVINAGHGAYSFYHYLGTLERFLNLGIEPDLFVVVVFGGNDFTTGLWHMFHGTRRPSPPRSAAKLKKACMQQYPKAFGQVLNTVEYFVHSGPEEIALAHVAANTILGEIQRQCEERGIGLLVALLPSPSDTPEQTPMENIHAGLEVLELGPEYLEVITRMGDRFVSDQQAAGVSAMDLRPAFQAQSVELFWRHDLHLNVAGHEVMAEQIAPWVEQWWSSRGQ